MVVLEITVVVKLCVQVQQLTKQYGRIQKRLFIRCNKELFSEYIRMKHSKYNYVVENNGYYIIFNGLYCTCVILDEKHYKQYQKLNFSKKDIDEFKRLGFILESNIDETEKFLYLARIRDYKKSSIGFRVLTTLNCNANCSYCYEKGFKQSNMTDMVANKTADYILKKVRGVHSAHIQWFGGEPLANYKAIDTISEKLIPEFERYNIKFKSSMVSNGLLFNQSLIKKATDNWMLSNVQITLDGTKEIYEKIKQFPVENAFERVIDNIHKLLDAEIHVSIRLNYDDTNFTDIIDLISYLSAEFPERQKLRLYTYRLFSAQEDSAKDIKLLKHLVDCGFASDLIYTFYTHYSSCMAHSINGGTIMPNGNIAKCCRGSQLPNGIVGTINEDDYNDNIYSWCSPQLNDKCYKCKYLPLCNGGCRYEHFTGGNACFISDSTMEFILQQTLKDKLKDNL